MSARWPTPSSKARTTRATMCSARLPKAAATSSWKCRKAPPRKARPVGAALLPRQGGSRAPFAHQDRTEQNRKEDKMAAITASMVGELRAKTDAPMMECKKALTEAEGNMEK